ncbi:MAG: FG-GAP-like repeat-containing protein [Nannocystaceae bacterium]|nr:FG-GAP-like repeat-containing protein [bacterium]
MHVFDIGGAYQPLIGDFDGDGDSDIFWYRSGQGGDALWLSRGDGSFAKSGRTVNGPYTPLIGDFNRDDISDIYWYRPGDGADYLWLFTETGGKAATRLDMVEDEGHVPLTGDLDGNGAIDIYWRSTNDAPDYIWMGSLDGQFDQLISPVEIESGVPFLTDWDDDGWDDIVFSGTPPVVLRSVGPGEFALTDEPRYDDLMSDHE